MLGKGVTQLIPRRAISRQEFMKFSGAGLAGAMLLGTAGCGGGQQGSGSGSDGEINPDDTSPIQMTLAGASAQGFFRALGETIGSVVREVYPGSTIEYQPGSPAGSLAQAATGQTELAAPTSSIEYRLAREGTQPFEESLQGQYAGVMKFYSETIPITPIMNASFAEEHGIGSFQDLADKQPPLRIVINQQGNTQAIIPAQEIFGAYGFSFEDIEEWGGQIFYQSSGPGVELLADRQVDMYFNGTFAPNSDLAEVARSLDLTWVDMEEDILQQVSNDWGIPAGTFESGTYEFVGEDKPTVFISHDLTVNDGVPAQDVYKLVKAVYENQGDIQALHPSMEVFSGEMMARVSEEDIPLHPGAEQLYTEEGLLG